MVNLLVAGYVHLRPVRLCRRVGGTKRWDVVPRDHRLKLDRRRMLQGSLGLAGLGLLAGCGLMPTPDLRWRSPNRIGVLLSGGPTSNAENYAAFRAGLAELGYGEGRDVVLEARYADG